MSAKVQGIRCKRAHNKITQSAERCSCKSRYKWALQQPIMFPANRNWNVWDKQHHFMTLSSIHVHLNNENTKLNCETALSSANLPSKAEAWLH